jgi:signal transduction histidine kinase
MAKTMFEFPAQVDVTHFISRYAHDLRSLFNHIVGFSKIVLNGQDGPLTDLQKEDLTTVYTSGLQALTLMNNLIEMARLNRGEKDVSPSEIDARQFLEKTVREWKKYHATKELHVEYRLMLSSPVLWLDETPSRQALFGFMSYVAEYLAPGAKMTITAAQEPEWWVLTVEGSGPGAKVQSEFDLVMAGYISRALVELGGGEVRQGEMEEGNAVIQFALPKEPAESAGQG